MKVQFRDFERKEKRGLLGISWSREEIQASLDDVNKWIDDESIDVINIETLIKVSGVEGASTAEVGIRVWYRK